VEYSQRAIEEGYECGREKEGLREMIVKTDSPLRIIEDLGMKPN
jgi:hypothetical protein